MSKAPDRCLEEFSIGNYVSFTRRYSLADFETFSSLSGDRNPLHHDSTYASGTKFGEVIVPLHLVAAPLSAVVGMMLPGERSLYLSTRQCALKPVRYGRDITYSAKIVAKQAANSLLVLRVLALDETEVLFDAEIVVQVRNHGASAALPSSDGLPSIKTTEKRCALITGASGSIGRAISVELAKRGWKLRLHCHSDLESGEKLVERCRHQGVEVDLIQADLATVEGVEALLAGNKEEISDFLHLASPPIDASLDHLMAINFTAFKELINGLVPSMLVRQDLCIMRTK